MQKLALVLSFALAAAPLRAQGSAPAAAAMDRAVAAYAKVSTARATFVQTIRNPLTGTTVNAKGEMVLTKKPNRFSVRFTEPAGDRIVADGQSLWVYLPSTNPGQVVKMPMGASGSGPDVVNDLLDGPRDKFTITDAGVARVSGKATHAVQLVPKSPRQFTKAIVWIDDADATVRQFELIEPSGLVRRVRLTSYAKNVKVADAAFAFTPPKNTRVFDGTRAGSQ